MKFNDFLNSIDEFDGELVTKEYESEFSFVWDKNIKITNEGKKRFSNVLNSEIKINTRNGATITLNENIKETEYNLFMQAVAGYVPDNLYHKWFRVATRV